MWDDFRSYVWYLKQCSGSTGQIPRPLPPARLIPSALCWNLCMIDGTIRIPDGYKSMWGRVPFTLRKQRPCLGTRLYNSPSVPTLSSLGILCFCWCQCQASNSVNWTSSFRIARSRRWNSSDDAVDSIAIISILRCLEWRNQSLDERTESWICLEVTTLEYEAPESH